MEKKIIKKKIINGFTIGQYGSICAVTEDGSIYYKEGSEKPWVKLPDIEEIIEV